jgi:hypothetical protein
MYPSILKVILDVSKALMCILRGPRLLANRKGCKMNPSGHQVVSNSANCSATESQPQTALVVPIMTEGTSRELGTLACYSSTLFRGNINFFLG